MFLFLFSIKCCNLSFKSEVGIYIANHKNNISVYILWQMLSFFFQVWVRGWYRYSHGTDRWMPWGDVWRRLLQLLERDWQAEPHQYQWDIPHRGRDLRPGQGRVLQWTVPPCSGVLPYLLSQRRNLQAWWLARAEVWWFMHFLSLLLQKDC